MTMYGLPGGMELFVVGALMLIPVVPVAAVVALVASSKRKAGGHEEVVNAIRDVHQQVTRLNQRIDDLEATVMDLDEAHGERHDKQASAMSGGRAQGE